MFTMPWGLHQTMSFFMFMAEASVYAVMGAMLGYLLSQVTGTILTWFGVTSGLNMDYSSIETIYASLAIVAAVLISTLIPAREAARLASPAEDSHLTIPKVENDTMTFNLPFTFTAHDRVAVISYFYRWLDANGEGSSGMFYCTKPEPLVTEGVVPAGTEVIPGITSIVWLKPYDMGVSQRLTINLPTDPENWRIHRTYHNRTIKWYYDGLESHCATLFNRVAQTIFELASCYGCGAW